MADEQTVNVSQLVLVLILGGLAVRYFFFSTPGPRSTGAPNSTSSLRAREADVETIQQMFPQVARRSIMWDLQRNGGSVAATTERILSGRGLDNPPQTFQPPLPAPGVSPLGSAQPAAAPKATPPDLITRYNLADKIASSDNEDTTISTPPNKQSWSQNKGERHALLQRRREEMILAARKKMEARVAAEAGEQKEDK